MYSVIYLFKGCESLLCVLLSFIKISFIFDNEIDLFMLYFHTQNPLKAFSCFVILIILKYQPVGTLTSINNSKHKICSRIISKQNLRYLGCPGIPLWTIHRIPDYHIPLYHILFYRPLFPPCSYK